MALIGTCDECGGETSDYSCLNCVMAERDRYKAALERIAKYMGGLEAQRLAKEALKDES